MTPPPPPIPLAYANPQGGPPLGSTITLEHVPGGVRLTQPIRPSGLTAAAVGLVGVWAWFAAVVIVVQAVSLVTGGDPGRAFGSAIVGVAFAAVGLQVLRHARFLSRPRTLSVDLRGGRLAVTNGPIPGPINVTGRTWTVDQLRRFNTPVRGMVVLRGRPLYSLTVSARRRLDRTVLESLTRDEAAWLNGVLNAALAGHP